MHTGVLEMLERPKGKRQDPVATGRPDRAYEKWILWSTEGRGKRLQKH